MTPLDPTHGSPLLLCDRLISLAKDADRAGYAATAGRLAELVERMFDEQPHRKPAHSRLRRQGPPASR